MKKIINPTIVHSATQPTEKADLWIKALPNNQNTLMIFDNGYENVDSNLTERLNNEAQAREDADIAEANKRLEEDTKLNNRVDKEITDRTNADNALNTTLTNKINEEANARTNADNALSNRITTNLNSINTINSKIPSQASHTNQLADKEFVNSSIANDAATFQGTFESVNDLPTTNVKKNDYAFIVTVVSGGNPEYKRYKYNGTQWLEEFVLNNSSFTANQWTAINSGISSNWMNDTTQSINEEIQARQDADNLIWEKLNKMTSQVQEITWAELKALRDNSNLTSGQFYRITDYQCTTVQSDTRSAGNQFDIIVLALTNNTLLEQAWAALHSGDTYFANSNLSAWKLWYCLDNDTTRFAWADSTNGKGVIYRMIDEFNNDIPYDFKNIQFKHPRNTTEYPYYYYTFASSTVEANTDLSLSTTQNIYLNKILPNINSSKQYINRILFIGSNCYGNTFGINCYNSSFLDTCYFNIFGNNCFENSFSSSCVCNTFRNNCSANNFRGGCTNNIFENYCRSNNLGTGCSYNIFGIDCQNNIFGSYCSHNIFGNRYLTNILENGCSYNTFGKNCQCIKFSKNSSGISNYSYYQHNHFGDGCQYILFKGEGSETPNTQVQNYNFAQGLQGTSDAYLTVDGIRNRSYETKVAKNSAGELKIYCEADLVQ